jgi:hypothetical membrane protein
LLIFVIDRVLRGNLHHYRRGIGGLAWLFAAGFVISEIACAAAWTGSYSFVHDSISDLGDTACTHLGCSPLHAFMNVSFVAVGLLMIVGAVLLSWSLPPGKLRPISAAAGLVIGASTAATGLFPLNLDRLTHFAVVLPAFIGRHLILIALAACLWNRHRAMAVWSATCAAAGLVGAALLAIPGFPFGVAERVTVYPLPVWMVFIGAAVVLTQARKVLPPGLRVVGSRAVPFPT